MEEVEESTTTCENVDSVKSYLTRITKTTHKHKDRYAEKEVR